MTFQELLKKETTKATLVGLESSAIKILIQELSGYDPATFLVNINEEISDKIFKKITDAIYQYLELKKPIQHILGYSYFYGYKFKVNPNVLIPRPETEELVNYVLKEYQKLFNGCAIKLVDIGTGSGAIAVSIAKEESQIQVYATDISKPALEIAKLNALNNEAKVTFLEGDMLEPLIYNQLKFDILVSNPPYIRDDDFVEEIVRNNEPHLALFGGIDGMKYYELILKDVNKVLNTPNIIAFEHGFYQKELMHKLVEKYCPKATTMFIKDLNGKDRITLIINR